MDDFNIEPGQRFISAYTLGYSVLFAVAAFVFCACCVLRVMAWRRGTAAATKIDSISILFPRWGIFVGLLLLLLRHLRFVIPGAVAHWQPALLSHAAAIVGGALLAVGAGALWLRAVRARAGVEACALGLLAIVPVLGFLTARAGTDLAAVRAFVRGLLHGEFHDLPADPLLAAHLAAASAALALLPLSRLLWAQPPDLSPRRGWAIAIAVAVPLMVPATAAAIALQTGGVPDVPDFPGLVRAHRTAPGTVMNRYHAPFLAWHLNRVIHAGTRSPNDDIESCVACHMVKDAAGMPVRVTDERHFCTACHAPLAVRIDCFGCHAQPTTAEGVAQQ